MRIVQSFAVARPRPVVWDLLADVPGVAACVPGAEITEALGQDRYKGRVTVKLGPVTAAFSGEVAVARRGGDWSGTVEGKGADTRTGSRARAEMSYRLTPAEEGRATLVEIEAEIALTGTLAQFGKSAVINEIAARLTRDFAQNLHQRLGEIAPTAETAAPAAAAPLRMERLVLRLLWARIAAWLARGLRRVGGTR